MNRKFVLLFILAFLVRLVFVFPQFSGDVKNHLVWGHSVLESGVVGFYDRHFVGFNDANYPPVTIFLFSLSVFIYQTVTSTFVYLNNAIGLFPSFLIPLFQSQNMQVAFLKLPAILADLGIGYMIYRFTHKKLFAILYLFNPAVIYVSAVWGQIESLPIFFIMLSYFLIPRRYYLSHLVFILAVLTKQTALWVLPVFIIAWLKQGNIKTTLQGLTLQLATFVLFYLPFTLSFNPLPLFIKTLSGSSTLISDKAGNLWYFLFAGARVEDSLSFWGLTIRLWSILLLVVSFLVICHRLWRSYSIKLVADGLFWLSLVAFFFQTRVHDRHLAPVIPLLLISTISQKYKIPLYLSLSTYHFINLYLALRLPFI